MGLLMHMSKEHWTFRDYLPKNYSSLGLVVCEMCLICSAVELYPIIVEPALLILTSSQGPRYCWTSIIEVGLSYPRTCN